MTCPTVAKVPLATLSVLEVPLAAWVARRGARVGPLGEEVIAGARDL